MYPVVHQNPDQAFELPISEFQEKLERALPTFDRSLDVYFDRKFSSIIEEWELLTDDDLHQLEGRLAAVTVEIDGLYTAKGLLEKRIKNLDTLISSLEGVR
jgi:hypothetical protein